MATPNLNPLDRLRSAGEPSAARTSVVIPVSGAAAHAWTASTDLYTYITERGFYYPREVVTRYLLSLRTNPFALLSGITGTGKTKLALLTAEYFAWKPGTRAIRYKRPVDSEKAFFLPVDRVTLRSGTLTPARDQLDYFNVDLGGSANLTINITNILGAHGDMSIRATNIVFGGRKILTLALPVTVRTAFEQTGVRPGDYLKFEIAEEFKRFSVSLHRPEAEEIDVPPQHRYAFVSVRPSWSDHHALLGGYDDDLERYMRTPLLELLLRAHREEQEAQRQERVPVPYFVILDEMNIAKIEHYFSDFLSALETRRYDADGNITQESLNLHDADAQRITWIDDLGIEYEIPPRLPIPGNVLFTGTVNDDASTYDLSPKVLDRANVIEFSAVDFRGFLDGNGGEGAAIRELPSALRLDGEATKNFGLGEIELGGLAETQRLRDVLDPLVSVNELLVEDGMHFGYRVLNEIALYVRNARDTIGDSDEVTRAALDACVLQKVLPKFFHAEDDRRGILARLLVACLSGSVPAVAPPRDDLMNAVQLDAADRASYDAELAGTGEGIHEAVWPRSAGRLWRLLQSLR